MRSNKELVWVGKQHWSGQETGGLWRAVCKLVMGLGVYGRKFDLFWGYFAGAAAHCHPLNHVFD